jgi:hypothetical protein
VSVLPDLYDYVLPHIEKQTAAHSLKLAMTLSRYSIISTISGLTY